jgi:hypothetical protein
MPVQGSKYSTLACLGNISTSILTTYQKPVKHTFFRLAYVCFFTVENLLVKSNKVSNASSKSDNSDIDDEDEDDTEQDIEGSADQPLDF